MPGLIMVAKLRDVRYARRRTIRRTLIIAILSSCLARRRGRPGRLVNAAGPRPASFCGDGVNGSVGVVIFACGVGFAHDRHEQFALPSSRPLSDGPDRCDCDRGRIPLWPHQRTCSSCQALKAVRAASPLALFHRLHRFRILPRCRRTASTSPRNRLAASVRRFFAAHQRLLVRHEPDWARVPDQLGRAKGWTRPQSWAVT
jgi:hypothetical protein